MIKIQQASAIAKEYSHVRDFVFKNELSTTGATFAPCMISGAFPQKDTANCDTFIKIGTNEGHTMLINLRPGGILEVNAFCQKFDKIQYGH